MKAQDLDLLIGKLTQELCPVKCRRHPLRCFLLFMVLLVGYEAVVVFAVGLRFDIVSMLYNLHFITDIVLSFFVLTCAALASAWLCVPDMRGRSWLPVLPLSAVGFFLFWMIFNFLSENGSVLTSHPDECYQWVILSTVLPMIALVFLMRKGATTRPVLSGFMNALAVGAAGYIGLRLICGASSSYHDVVYHVLPFVIFGGVASMFARRLYRW